MNKKQLRNTYIKELFLNNKINLVVTMIVTILLATLMLLISYIMQRIIDVISTGNIDSFKEVSILTLTIMATLFIVYLLNTIFFPKFIYKATRQYKKFAFEKIIDRDISSFKNTGSSVYISALTNDLNSIETNYIASTFTLVMQVLMFFGSLALMFWYSPVLTLVSIGLAFIPLVFTIIYGRNLTKYEKNVSDKNESFVHFVKDSLSGFTTIKSFKAETKIKELFNKNNDSTEAAKEQRKRAQETLDMAGQIGGAIAQFGVFLFGAYLSINGHGITAGVVVVFVQLMNFVVSPIAIVPKLLASRKACIPLIDKLAEASLKKSDSLTAVNDITLNKNIVIDNVSFSYDEKEVLNGISYVFEANKSYAIIGESGSGKSTLLNLLMDNESNYTGTIKYDDVNLDTIKPSSVADLVSLIEQNVFVFDSTVLNNITMYDEFPKEEVDEVINKSGLSKFIEEKGSTYSCGEGGKNLSGGEKQRISIARGLLKESKLLLMDEATSALDNETSINVSKAILNINNATKIIITHRLESSILKMYDKILVMKNGKIAESGNFNELMDKQSLFYSIFSLAQN